MKFLLLILCILKRIEISSQYKYEIKRDNNYFSHPYIKMCYGQPQQCLNTVIDLFSKISCVSDYNVDQNPNSYQIEKSSTVVKTEQLNTLFFQDGSVTGKEIKEQFLPDSTIKMTFLFIQWFTLEREQFDNLLGLQMKSFTNETEQEIYSVLEFLQKNKVITRKVFTLTPDYFYLGELPPEVKKNYNILKRCKSSQYYNAWNCPMMMLDTQDKKMSLKFDSTDTLVKFYTRKDGISAPKDYGLLIIDHYLGNQYLKDYCRKESVYQEARTMKCTKDIKQYIRYIDGLDFYISSEIILQVNNDVLFKENIEGGYDFILTAYDISYWEFGDDVIRKESMMFDMDNYEIGFIRMSHDNNGTLKKLMIFIFIIALLGIVVLIASFYRYKTYNLY